MVSARSHSLVVCQKRGRLVALIDKLPVTQNVPRASRSNLAMTIQRQRLAFSHTSYLSGR